jgi:hypothetical protein
MSRAAPRRGYRARFATLVLLGVLAGAALAQSSGGDFSVPRVVVAGGSASASGGDFRVTATSGQPEAGIGSGGTFRVQGGFWPQQAAPSGDAIFCDGFEAQACVGSD